MDNKRKIVFGPDVSFAGSGAYKLLRTNLMFAPADRQKVSDDRCHQQYER